MINLIMHGRNLAIDVFENSIVRYVRERCFFRVGLPGTDASLASDRAIRAKGDLHLDKRSVTPLRFDCRDDGGSKKDAEPDPPRIAGPIQRLRDYARARSAWVSNGGRSASVLDASVPLEQMLELMPLPIVAIDQRNRIVFANARTSELFGYIGDELIDAPAETLFPIDAACEDPSYSARHDTENKIADVEGTQVLVARRRDGANFPAEVNTSRHGRRNHALLVVAILDRSACTEIQRSREDLEHLARVSSLGELAGSLAHELKQPLTAILFNAQAAQQFLESETANAAELHDALEDIVTDGCRASDVIRKIHTLARKGEVELRPLDIGALVCDIALLVRSDATARGIRLRFSVAENLAMVCGDKVQLQQVVLNLLLNAFDAVRDRDPAERLVETFVGEEPDGGVRITVKDWGQGLTIDKMHKIFRAFYTTKPQGLGLGLSISRTIISGHGGRLWAQSNEGPGASFHVTLPRSPGPRQDSGPRSP